MRLYFCICQQECFQKRLKREEQTDKEARKVCLACGWAQVTWTGQQYQYKAEQRQVCPLLPFTLYPRLLWLFLMTPRENHHAPLVWATLLASLGLQLTESLLVDFSAYRVTRVNHPNKGPSHLPAYPLSLLPSSLSSLSLENSNWQFWLNREFSHFPTEILLWFNLPKSCVNISIRTLLSFKIPSPFLSLWDRVSFS